MTEQPDWKCVANIGDVNPKEFGGAFVFVDETGVYPPEMEVIFPPEEGEERVWEVYRLCLEKCTFVDGVLSDNKFHPDLKAWFADGISSVAETHGVDELHLLQLLCSEDPINLAWGYRYLYDYYGLENFDHGSLILDGREISARLRRKEYRC